MWDAGGELWGDGVWGFEDAGLFLKGMQGLEAKNRSNVTCLTCVLNFIVIILKIPSFYF